MTSFNLAYLSRARLETYQGLVRTLSNRHLSSMRRPTLSTLPAPTVPVALTICPIQKPPQRASRIPITTQQPQLLQRQQNTWILAIPVVAQSESCPRFGYNWRFTTLQVPLPPSLPPRSSQSVPIYTVGTYFVAPTNRFRTRVYDPSRGIIILRRPRASS